MASKGQRFRRKALRRGYKVDEVDDFLDRVEATLAGTPVGAPVSAQEVHDVVFRVRFGGYDEWQVDLHLDRVERQVAELEEHGAGRGPDPRTAERVGPPGADRFGPSDRMGPPDRLAPPPRDERGWPAMPPPMPPQMPPPPMPPPMPPRPMPAQAGPPHDQYGRYDEPAGFGGYEGSRGGYDGPPVPPGRVGPGGFGGPVGPNGPLAPNGPVGPNGPGGFGPDDRFGYGGFEPGRHGKPEMTTDIRRPDRDPRIGARGPAPVPVAPPPMAGTPMGPPPVAGPPMGPPPMVGPPLGAGGGGDVQRVDTIRRSLQVRRFGSGYDPDQVNRFFDQILTAMSGRGPMPVNPADLPATRFGLVPGGYFEAEVEAALRQVQDILRRR